MSPSVLALTWSTWTDPVVKEGEKNPLHLIGFEKEGLGNLICSLYTVHPLLCEAWSCSVFLKDMLPCFLIWYLQGWVLLVGNVFCTWSEVLTPSMVQQFPGFLSWWGVTYMGVKYVHVNKFVMLFSTLKGACRAVSHKSHKIQWVGPHRPFCSVLPNSLLYYSPQMPFVHTGPIIPSIAFWIVRRGSSHLLYQWKSQLGP